MFYEVENINAKSINLTEGKSEKSKFKALVLTANLLNQNGRYYPAEVVQAATEKLQNAIEARRVYGSSSHSGTEVHDISHRILGLEFDKEKNELWMQGEILDTTRGSDLKTILKAGGSLGLSIAAYGKTKKEKISIGGKNVEVDMVEPGLEISKIDFTTDPSFPDSRMDAGSMFESEDFSIENNEDIITAEREDMKKDFRKIFDEKKDSGEIDLEEVFEDWLKDHGLSDEEIDEEIRKDRESKTASDISNYNEALTSGFTGNLEQFKETQSPEHETDNEVVRLFSEAQEAGYKGSFEDFLEIEKNEK